MPKRRNLAVAAVLVAASSGAIAGATTALAMPSRQAPTSCTVVTRSQVATALGQAVTSGVRGKAVVEGGIACVYYGPSAPANANADDPVTDSVRVVLVTGATGKHYFNDYRKKVKAQPVSGLGDKAFYDGVGSLSVLKGEDYLRVAVIRPNGASLSGEETLARYALPNM